MAPPKNRVSTHRQFVSDNVINTIWTDQDDAPELTKSFFDQADLYLDHQVGTHEHAESNIAALKKASKALDKLLEARSVDVESVVADFKSERHKSPCQNDKWPASTPAPPSTTP